MRIDIKTCNDIDLLRGECERLQKVVDGFIREKEIQSSGDKAKLAEFLESFIRDVRNTTNDWDLTEVLNAVDSLSQGHQEAAMKPAYERIEKIEGLDRAIRSTKKHKLYGWKISQKSIPIILEAARRYSQHASAAIPEGYVLVPREPTREMWARFYHSQGLVEPQFCDWMNTDLRARQEKGYRAMIEAAAIKDGEEQKAQVK